MHIKAVYIIGVLLFICVTAKSQIFIISPLASSTDNYTITSSSIIFDGKRACLVFSSGLSVLRNAIDIKGDFGENCIEKPPVITIPEVSIFPNIFPNPTTGLTTIKVAGKFDPNLSCQIRVMSIDGKIMLNKIVLVSELSAGFVFDANAYTTGTYVATVEFMNQFFSLKFKKV